MCVRYCTRLLIVSLVILSTNQACGLSKSKTLASSNPKSGLLLKTSEKEPGERYYRKATENPKHRTDTKHSLASAKINKKKTILDSDEQDEQQLYRESRRLEALSRNNNQINRHGTGPESGHPGGFMQVPGSQKSRANPVPEDQDLFAGFLSSGWDDNDKSLLRKIDKKRLQTIDDRESDSCEFCLEPDYYERIAPGLNPVYVGSLYSSEIARKQKSLDPDHIREFNQKKTKAMESFLDSEETGLEDNLIGELNERTIGGESNNGNDEELTDAEAEELLKELMLESPGNEEEISRILGISESPKEKAKQDFLGEYRDAMQKIHEIYKLLSTSVTSGAETLNEPERYESKTGNRMEPETQNRKSSGVENSLNPQDSKRKPELDLTSVTPKYLKQVFVKSNYIDGSAKKPPEVKVELSYPEYLKQKLLEAEGAYTRKAEVEPGYPEYPKRPKVPEGSGYMEGSRKKTPEVDPKMGYAGEYARRKPDVDPGYSRQAPKNAAGSNYPEAPRRKPEAEIDAWAEADYYARRQLELGYSRKAAGGPETYSKWKPEVSFYPDYSSEEYLEPEERNLASPQCKFSNLDPSRESASDEEDRNLQFRSFRRNEKVGRKTGTQNNNKNGGKALSPYKDYTADHEEFDAERFDQGAESPRNFSELQKEGRGTLGEEKTIQGSFEGERSRTGNSRHLGSSRDKVGSPDPRRKGLTVDEVGKALDYLGVQSPVQPNHLEEPTPRISDLGRVKTNYNVPPQEPEVSAHQIPNIQEVPPQVATPGKNVTYGNHLPRPEIIVPLPVAQPVPAPAPAPAAVGVPYPETSNSMNVPETINLLPVGQPVSAAASRTVAPLPVGQPVAAPANQLTDTTGLQKGREGTQAGGCRNIFKCLADLGQTLISPTLGTSPEVPATHQPQPSVAGPVSPYGSTRDATGGNDSIFMSTGNQGIGGGGFGDPSGSTVTGNTGTNYLEHPFYGLVHTIISAAQEARRERLQDPSPRVKSRPETVKLEATRKPPTGNEQKPEVASPAVAPQISNSPAPTPQVASAPNPKPESEKMSGRPSQSTGGKVAQTGNRLTGSAAKPVSGSTRKLPENASRDKLEALRAGLSSKLQAQNGAGKLQKSKPAKPEMTGKSKNTGNSLQSQLNKGVGAFKKVAFTPVGLKKPNTQVGAAQKLSPKVESKSPVGAKKGGQNVEKAKVGAKMGGPKTQAAHSTASSSPANSVAAPVATSSPAKRSPASEKAAKRVS